MPPVGFAKKTGTRRVRFLTGVFHDGVDYGPEMDQDEADIDPASALTYVQQGRAVYTDVSEAEGADGTIVPDEEVVIGTGSSVRAVVGGGAVGSVGGTVNSEAPDDEVLAEDFPGHAALSKASITTYAQLRAVRDLMEIPGIGEATSAEIQEALAARPQRVRAGLDTRRANAIVSPGRRRG